MTRALVRLIAAYRAKLHGGHLSKNFCSGAWQKTSGWMLKRLLDL